MVHRFLAASSIAALAALVLPRDIRAEGTVTGSQLMQACTSKTSLDDRECIGYIAGAVDQVSANPALKAAGLCPVPQGVTLRDVKADLLRYGREHADKIGQPAILLLNDVIKDRYRCK